MIIVRSKRHPLCDTSTQYDTGSFDYASNQNSVTNKIPNIKDAQYKVKPIIFRNFQHCQALSHLMVDTHPLAVTKTMIDARFKERLSQSFGTKCLLPCIDGQYKKKLFFHFKLNAQKNIHIKYARKYIRAHLIIRNNIIPL